MSEYLEDETSSPHPSLLTPDPGNRVYVYHSASVTFYAPTNPSATNDLQREHIRATPSWWGGSSRYDTVFATGDLNIPGFRGLLIGRVRLLFSFFYRKKRHSCALVEWYSTYGSSPDEDTGLWLVTPDVTTNGIRKRGVIPLDSIVRGAHLIPAYGPKFLPPRFDPKTIDIVDAFSAYYVNKFVDHHAHALLV